MTLNWTLIPGTPNYHENTHGLTAVYYGTFNGYGSYKLYKDNAKRVSANVLSVGGLPTRL